MALIRAWIGQMNFHSGNTLPFYLEFHYISAESYFLLYRTKAMSSFNRKTKHKKSVFQSNFWAASFQRLKLRLSLSVPPLRLDPQVLKSAVTTLESASFYWFYTLEYLTTGFRVIFHTHFCFSCAYECLHESAWGCSFPQQGTKLEAPRWHVHLWALAFFFMTLVTHSLMHSSWWTRPTICKIQLCSCESRQSALFYFWNWSLFTAVSDKRSFYPGTNRFAFRHTCVAWGSAISAPRSQRSDDCWSCHLFICKTIPLPHVKLETRLISTKFWAHAKFLSLFFF